VKGKRCDDFMEITGISKSNIKNLSPDVQKQIDNFIGIGKATIIVRQQ